MAHQLKDREAYQRLNYLHQAAHCVLSQNPENVELARFYSFTQRTIARRLVLRQDPSVKRTICKKCFSLLIPGVTATTRQQRKKRKTRFTVVTCLSCGQSKKFLNNPDYCLWVDNPKAQMDQQKPPDSGHSAQHQTKKDKKADGSQASKSSATQSKDGT
ncbi:ribonuclease P protein subunit p21 isoform X2 [Platichthys flesus]|uniref:ribonuclease P protein subunit p21 isoform X2 n=1 Tax=Platichthys flesus TaxID=8260 RepID=UPI002DBF7355|nr:ribonuclease P protein subunit p21 isoform X2 [Platichthys flesus]